MKKLLAVIGVAALLATCNAQTTNPPAWWEGAIGFAQGTSEGKQLTIAAYPSYAPDLVVDGKKAPWGMGVAALYPVLTDYTFIGARMDWLADSFWTPSVNATVRADVQLFGHNFTPFAMGGVVYPIGGAGEANHDVGPLVGAGVYTTLWKPKEKVSLQAFFQFEHWFNKLDVDIYHPGIALTIKF